MDAVGEALLVGCMANLSLRKRMHIPRQRPDECSKKPTVNLHSASFTSFRKVIGIIFSYKTTLR